jgi:hypothetical protein
VEGRKAKSFLDAFREYFNFLIGRAVALPGEYGRSVAERTRQRIEQIVTHGLFGSDSEVVVTFGGRALPADPEPFSFDAEQTLLRQAQQILGDPPDPPFNAALWTELRDASFAIVDGAGLDEGWGWRPIQGDSPVVTWPSAVVPPPRSRLTIGTEQLRSMGLDGSAPVTLGACDALAAFRVVTRLAEVRADPSIAGSNPTAQAPSPVRPVSSETEAPPPAIHLGDEQAVATVPLTPGLGGSNGSPVLGEPFAEPDPDLDPVAVAVGDELGSFGDTAIGSSEDVPVVVSLDDPDDLIVGGDPLEGLGRALEDWARERRSSFLYGVAERSAVQITMAEAAIEESLSILSNPPKDPRPPKGDNVGRSLLVIGVIGALVALFVGWKSWLSWPIAITVAVVVAFGCFIGGLIRAARQLNAMFREMYRRPPAKKITEWAVERLRNAVNELARLQLQYSVLMEWCLVLGYLLHEPFVRPSGDGPDDPFRQLESTPDSVTILRAGRSVDRASALINKIRKLVFRRQWITEMYRQVEATMLQIYRVEEGIPPTERVVPPAEETGARTRNTRAFLLEQLDSGRLGEWAWHRMVERIEEQLREVELRELFNEFDHEGTRTAEAAWGREVDSVESFLGALVPTSAIAAITDSVLSESAKIQVGGRVRQMYLALPPQIVVPPLEEIIRAFSPTPIRSGSDLWTIGVRIDMSDNMAPAQCRLFDPGGDEPPSGPVVGPVPTGPTDQDVL